METVATKRIQKEFLATRDTEDNKRCGISVELIKYNDDSQPDCFIELKGKIAGPPDTPYEGGNFIIEILVPPKYPFEPPLFRFVTQIWHPNISSETGEVHASFVWHECSSLRTLLLSLQALLAAANPDERGDAVVAKQYKTEPEMFELTARHWTQVYAGAPGSNPDFEAKIERLILMGVEEYEARKALSTCSWDTQKADKLLSV